MSHSSSASTKFRQNLAIMLLGTGVAQLIPVLAMPMLSRMYDPVEFGVLALFLSLVSVFSVVGMARYELAIVLPKSHIESLSLVFSSILLAFFYSFLVFLALLFWEERLYQFLGINKELSWLIILPFAIFVTCISQSFYYWFSRLGLFRISAVARILQSGGVVTAQIVLAVQGGGHGLVFGRVAGSTMGLVYLIGKFFSKSSDMFKDVRFKKARVMLDKYSNFPKYSIWGALLDTMALQVPVIAVSRFLDLHTAGVFGFSFRVLSLPIALVGVSLAQVLFPKIVEIDKKNPEKLCSYVLKTFFYLVILIVPYVVLVYLYGSDGFTYIFGQEWKDAGQIVGYLACVVGIRFAISPLSCVLLLDRNVKLGVAWQLTYFVSIVVTLSIAGVYFQKYFFIIFCLHEVVLYALYLLFVLIGTRSGDDGRGVI